MRKLRLRLSDLLKVIQSISKSAKGDSGVLSAIFLYNAFAIMI